MPDESDRKILAASFPTPDGGSRAAGAIGGALPDKVGNTAVLFVKPDGKAKFVESRDWGAGRGALVGGVIGIIGGPIGILAGGTIGALASKLRDSGFKNDQLEALGKSLVPGSSLAGDGGEAARSRLASQTLQPRRWRRAGRGSTAGGSPPVGRSGRPPPPRRARTRSG